MENNVVKVSDIRPGVTVIEDIFANTKFPIIKKNTKLEAEHISFLEAFSIRFVKIAEQIVTRDEPLETSEVSPIDPDELINTDIEDRESLQVQYNRAVADYMKEFTSWRAGIRPDITKIRSIVLPLLESFGKERKMLTILSDFSHPKDYSAHHALAVGILSFAISKKLDLPEGQSLQLGVAGTMADCGMAKVSMSIIEKTAFLTKNEFTEVKKHVVHSYQMIKDSPLIRPEMKTAILQHHERLDGSGYPSGAKQEEITIFAQIIAVADVFHAMTSERYYRSKESPYKVLEMIMEEEFGKFDIKVVQALHELVCDLSIGSKVRLTSGQTGEIIFIHRDASLRPIVKLDNAEKDVIDLAVNRKLAVEKILN